MKLGASLEVSVGVTRGVNKGDKDLGKLQVKICEKWVSLQNLENLCVDFYRPQ